MRVSFVAIMAAWHCTLTAQALQLHQLEPPIDASADEETELVQTEFLSGLFAADQLEPMDCAELDNETMFAQTEFLAGLLAAGGGGGTCKSGPGHQNTPTINIVDTSQKQEHKLVPTITKGDHAATEKAHAKMAEAMVAHAKRAVEAHTVDAVAKLSKSGKAT